MIYQTTHNNKLKSRRIKKLNIKSKFQVFLYQKTNILNSLLMLMIFHHLQITQISIIIIINVLNMILVLTLIKDQHAATMLKIISIIPKNSYLKIICNQSHSHINHLKPFHNNNNKNNINSYLNLINKQFSLMQNVHMILSILSNLNK